MFNLQFDSPRSEIDDHEEVSVDQLECQVVTRVVLHHSVVQKQAVWLGRAELKRWKLSKK